jgi:hypothetical protein
MSLGARGVISRSAAAGSGSVTAPPFFLAAAGTLARGRFTAGAALGERTVALRGLPEPLAEITSGIEGIASTAGSTSAAGSSWSDSSSSCLPSSDSEVSLSDATRLPRRAFFFGRASAMACSHGFSRKRPSVLVSLKCVQWQGEWEREHAPRTVL